MFANLTLVSKNARQQKNSLGIRRLFTEELIVLREVDRSHSECTPGHVATCRPAMSTALASTRIRSSHKNPPAQESLGSRIQQIKIPAQWLYRRADRRLSPAIVASVITTIIQHVGSGTAALAPPPAELPKLSLQTT